MKKKTKKQITKVVLGAIGIFLLWLLISFNLVPSETASEFIVNNHDAALKIVNNVTDNLGFYGFLAALVTVTYYFLRYKK